MTEVDLLSDGFFYFIARIKQPAIQSSRNKYASNIVIANAAVVVYTSSLSDSLVPSLSWVIARTSYNFMFASTEAIMADAKDIIL